MAAHAGEWDMILGSVHCLTGDHSIFDSSTPLTSAFAWDDYFERLGDAVEHGGFDVVTHPLRLAVSRPTCPGTSATGSTAGRAGRSLRRGPRGQRLRPARLSRARAAALRVDRARRRAGQPRLGRASPARRGSRARPPSSCCVRTASRLELQRPLAEAPWRRATSPCDPGAALGLRAARLRDQRLRRLGPAHGDRAARLRAGHGDAGAHARHRRRAGRGRARELRRAAGVSSAASPC